VSKVSKVPRVPKVAINSDSLISLNFRHSKL
jgi:hypothetical protein